MAKRTRGLPFHLHLCSEVLAREGRRCAPPALCLSHSCITSASRILLLLYDRRQADSILSLLRLQARHIGCRQNQAGAQVKLTCPSLRAVSLGNVPGAGSVRKRTSSRMISVLPAGNRSAQWTVTVVTRCTGASLPNLHLQVARAKNGAANDGRPVELQIANCVCITPRQ